MGDALTSCRDVEVVAEVRENTSFAKEAHLPFTLLTFHNPVPIECHDSIIIITINTRLVTFAFSKC